MIQAEKQTRYIGPFLTMVFLFFIVGFLTTANTQFQGPLKETFLQEAGDLKNTFATLITFSWFLAYPVCGGLGAAWTTRCGYKTTLIRSLFLMILGMGCFFLSSWFTVRFPEVRIVCGGRALPAGFFIFLLGSFVAGASATLLQVVINPYLTACHVPHTQAIQRLAIGGSANSIGTTLAPFFVTGIVFGGLAMEEVGVDRLMLPFLGLMALLAAVVCLVSRLSLPDIEGTRTGTGERLERPLGSFRHLRLGVVAIFFYVGVEVCIGANINLYAMEQEAAGGIASGWDVFGLAGGNRTLAIPALLATLYWGGMLVGRLVGSSLRTVSPRLQLTVTTMAAACLALAAIVWDNPWLLAAVGLFHSIMWGAIFTLSVAGLGKYTAKASGLFMTGVVGGAILPLGQGMLADAVGGWRWSWGLVVAGELYMLYYALRGSHVRESDAGEGGKAGRR